MNHILSDFLSDTCNSLENLRRNNVYKEFYYHIKCENLEDFLSKDITQSVQYQDLLQDLMQIKGPVLYWYEITSSHSNNDIIKTLKEYKQKKQRATPVIYKNYDRLTKILYDLHQLGHTSHGEILRLYRDDKLIRSGQCI